MKILAGVLATCLLAAPAFAQSGSATPPATADQGKPPADEAKRKRRVLMVDVTGDAAVAKIELDLPAGKLVDYFTLLRIGGAWKIVHKSFTRLQG